MITLLSTLQASIRFTLQQSHRLRIKVEQNKASLYILVYRTERRAQNLHGIREPIRLFLRHAHRAEVRIHTITKTDSFEVRPVSDTTDPESSMRGD